MPDVVLRFLGIDKSGFLSSLISVLFILIFCVFPESPGNRLLNLALLGEKKVSIGTKLRVYRALPYLLFFSIPTIGQVFESKAGKVSTGGVLMLVLIFMSANAVAVFFSPDGRSLLDMKLGTRVFTPPKFPGQESPKLFGIRVW